MILPGTGFVGTAAWQCGNCGRVETCDIPHVTCYHVQTPPACTCDGGRTDEGHRIVWLMAPLNDMARVMDESHERQMTMWALKDKARRCMQEANW
jgi:hypothetical protein